MGPIHLPIACRLRKKPKLLFRATKEAYVNSQEELLKLRRDRIMHPVVPKSLIVSTGNMMESIWLLKPWSNEAQYRTRVIIRAEIISKSH